MSVSEVGSGYRGNVDPEEQAKARKFFDYGKTVSDTGNYDYAIDLYLQGLAIDPDDKGRHQELRDIAMKRKAMGGKALGMFDAAKRPAKEDKKAMLNAEKCLAYEPGNENHMLSLVESAWRAGYYDTVFWGGAMLFKSLSDGKSKDKAKYLALKNIYKNLKRYDLAVEAIQKALELDPLNMELQTEEKDLGAERTMLEGNYAAGGDFRQSARNLEKQQDLLRGERDVVDEDFMAKRVREAEKEYNADKSDGKLQKLIDALESTEDVESENRAIELLEAAYEKTNQFRWRQRVGKIQMAQMTRQERSLRAALQETPTDAALRADYEQFKHDQIEFEANEYKLWADNYPTDKTLRYQYGVRLIALKRFDEAIPILQEARQDPKLRFKASLDLGRAFLESGFVEEAIDTLQVIIDDYQVKGDDLSKEMNYWQGRAYEHQGANEQALKRYSQVAQWEFTYRDVQQRIRALRQKK